MPANSLDLEEMQSAAARACELMKALSNPDRLLILCQLSQQQMCVSDLEHTLGIVQPTLSQQLTVLRNAELVTTRREGKNIFYTLSSGPALAVIETLYQQYCENEASPISKRSKR